MSVRYSKDWHRVARDMWAADQLKRPPLERCDWAGASLLDKLAYEARARKFVEANHD